MKKVSVVYAALVIIILSSAAFFAGLHWKDHEVGVQLTSALGTQLVCEASSLKDDVAVASLLDNENSSDAKDMLVTGIKSRVVKLKAFGPYLNKRDQAMTMDALQDGEKYLSLNRPR
ncbi:hypothetical protein GCM10007862_07060 [Dyella lipolytica]|uniref:Uncharacterized protein n=1 Tax=Dyella lipolytica TaxID=1867835 RepID=A0ABW8J0C2_9GAMM|nr:hypothetical protein [Dyella lipolytica]GLQ45655.1 hypothetical protein GCM10007862_07060 [Dyella lipolytica]